MKLLRVLPLILITGCLDVVEHGNPIPIVVRTTNCRGESLITGAHGAVDLRFTARAGTSIVFSRVAPFRSIPETLAIATQQEQLVLEVDARDGEGRLIARGSSLPFASPSEETVVVALLPVGEFTRACNSLVTARAHHSATLLADGRILVVGGLDSTGASLSSMEIVTPGTAQDVGPLAITTPMGALRLPRARHAAAALGNGQVVISGGESAQSVLSSVLVVDPAFGFRTGAIGPANLPRSRHLAVAVDDGVFFVGGSTRSSTEIVANPAVERLDLATFRLETVSSLPEPRLEAALGRVGGAAIVAGGLEGSAVSNKVELVSIHPGSITRQLALNTARRAGQLVAHGTRALLVGGFDANGVRLASTEWINVDPPGASVIAGPPVSARGETCAIALPGERTLLFGGSAAPELLKADHTLEPIAFSGAATTGQACLLGADGTVVIIGGLDANGRPVDDVWRYVPPE